MSTSRFRGSRPLPLLLLLSALAFGGSGCEGNSFVLYGKIDRPLLLKKASGKVTRFEPGSLRLALTPELTLTGKKTRVTLYQKGISESTDVSVPIEKFDSDVYRLDESETKTGIAIVGERRRETVRHPADEVRECTCPSTWKVVKHGTVIPKSYVDEIYERPVSGQYRYRTDSDVEFLRTDYTFELQSRGVTSTIFTSSVDELADPSSIDSRFQQCMVGQAPARDVDGGYEDMIDLDINHCTFK